MLTGEKFKLFTKCFSIIKNELNINISTSSIIFKLDDFLFQDILIFDKPNLVVNICEVDKNNKRRYEILYKIHNELSGDIDEDNQVVLTKDYYIEKFLVNKPNAIKIFDRKYSLEEIESIVKSIVLLNDKLIPYHYYEPNYSKYIEFSYKNKKITDRIIPTMISRKLICSHGNCFLGCLNVGKFNNLQYIQQYPEEQMFLMIYMYQYSYHSENLNFISDLVDIFKRNKVRLNLLPIYIENIEWTINDIFGDTSLLIWLEEDEKRKIREIREKMLSVDHTKIFMNCQFDI